MRIALILALGLLLVSCGAAGTPTGSTSAGQTATVPTVELKPAPPAATNTPASAATPMAPGSVEAKVATALGKKVGGDITKLALTAKDAQDWPDSALGCPAPGMMYSQVVTPGFKLTYSDDTQTYDVHTDQSGARAVLCQNNRPVELPGGAE